MASLTPAQDDKQHSALRLPRRALCSGCGTGRASPGHALGASDLAGCRGSDGVFRALVGQRLGSSPAFRCCASLAEAAARS